MEKKILELSARATEYFCKKYDLDDESTISVCVSFMGPNCKTIDGSQAWFAAFDGFNLINTQWNKDLMNSSLEESIDLDLVLDMLSEYLDHCEEIDRHRMHEGSNIAEEIGYGD